MYANSQITPHISSLNCPLMIPSIFLLIMFHLLLVTEHTSSVRTLTATKQTPHRVTLTRTYSSRTSTRHTYRNTWNNNPSTSPTRFLLKPQNDLYIMTLDIGTPPVPISGVMDTGSDLIWTKCKTSTGLDSFFDPSKSMTFFPLYDQSCNNFGLTESCVANYTDGLSVSLTMGQEIFFLGNTQNYNFITFGCGQPNEDKYDGIIGMGRGPFSLISQLEQRVFAYCFGSRSDPESSSVLLTGSKASSLYSGIQTTTLIEQDDEQYYYISLEGISVGETRLPVSNFEIGINGDGGMIIDSGTTFTYLEQGIIDMISNEFMNQTKLEKTNENITQYDDLEHCFMYQGYNKDLAPKLVFHFEGADWELPSENYIYEGQNGEGGCLAFLPSDGYNIFGNVMQQNMLVLFDLDNNSLSFKHAICNEY